MNFCSNCGAKISQKALFCGECGSKIEPITEPAEIKSKQCPNCNYSTGSDESYCPDCGKKLLAGGKENKSSKQEQQSPIKKESKKVVHPAPEPVKKKKGGILRTLGKVAIWGFAIVILGVVALYFIGDSPDENNTRELKTETPIKVREAKPILAHTEMFSVIPTSRIQVFKHSDNITVTLPPQFNSKEQSLKISKATVDKSIEFKNGTPLMIFDITLDNGKQPLKPVDVSLKYNPDELDPNSSPEEQLAALRWDKERGQWLNLPISIDTKNHTVSAIVDHFTLFEWVIIGEVVTQIKRASDSGEVLLNDVYLTPEKNFRILYSKEEIYDSGVHGDREWKVQYKGSGLKYSRNHPLFIQDFGYFLEYALKKYTKEDNKFKNPAGKKKTWFKSYQKTIIVKLDSYLSKLKGDPFYEKIYDRIHIPISHINDESSAKITSAHELFHVVQSEYYGKLGLSKFTSPNRQWWLESTAEYAAYNIAWPQYSKEMIHGIGSNYLNFPIDDTESKSSTGHGWGDSPYEYKTSIWIQYLVAHGMDLKKMIEKDASDHPLSIKSLENYLWDTQKKSMHDIYREFATWMVFSNEGALKNYPLANFDKRKNQHNLIATKTSELTMGSEKKITSTFDLPGHYSSKLWAIKAIKDPLDKKNDKKAISIKVESKTPGITVDVFVVAKGERTLTPPQPMKSIYVADKPVLIFAKPNDLVLVAATQGSESGGDAEVIVSDAGIILEINPAELPNVKPREANDFTLTAKNIPEEIKKVTFEWNYNDGSEKGIHDFVSVSNGEANQKIRHSYEESDKEEIYPLKAVLKEAGKSAILAEAEALVTLPLAKPVLSVTPGISVGPPGATFDMEAKVSPRNTYKFEWEVSGFGETFTQEGEESGIAPVIDEEGEYSVTVKLYDLAGNYLNMAQVSITVEPDELDTEGMDGIVGIEEDENLEPFTHSGYWVLYDTKEINGCQFYESECWPLESCTGGKGSFSITVGSSTCGSNASGKSGSGTYTVPPAKLIPGETITFEVTASGSGYSRVDVSYYENIKKMSFNEKGHNKGDSSSWNNKIVGCWADASPAKGEYKIPENNGEEGALLIEGGGSIGSFETKRSYFFLYKWQK